MTTQQVRLLRMLSLVSGIFLFGGLVGPRDGKAAVYVVRPDGTGDFPNIQAAVDAVVDGDEILLAEGIYSGPGNGTIDLRGKKIRIRSELLNPNSCVIDLDAGLGQQGFLMTSGEDLDTIIQAITVQDGIAGNGSIGRLEGSGATFLDCRFLGGGGAASGGAFWLDRSDSEFYRCEFRGNQATNSAGAVYAKSGHVKFEGCSFIDNHAGYAGAINSYNNYSMTLVDCTFRGNQAEYIGAGAVYHRARLGPLTVDRCHFEGNSAGGVGGAIRYLGSYDFTVTGSTFVDNRCDELGGAIMTEEDGNVRISESLFAGNVAGESGGALAGIADTYAIEGCTFATNSAPSGSSVSASSNVGIDNSIFAFGDAPAFECETGAALFLSCCDIFGNMGGDWVGCIESQQFGNFSADPLFCDVANGDFRLADGSLCLPENNGCIVLIGARGEGCSNPSEAPEQSGSAVLSLSRPFPNPASSDLSVMLQITIATRGELAVYSVDGSRVRVLANRPWTIGTHQVVWNRRSDTGRPVSGGLYFLVLTTEDARIVRSVMVLH